MTAMTVEYEVKTEQDPDPLSPAEWMDAEALFLATTRNRYFQQNPERLDSDRPDAEEFIEFPLYAYAYIHGSVALSLTPFRCGWDSGRIGSVFVNRELFPGAGKQEAAAASIVNEWNQYLSGDVWWIRVLRGGLDVESCRNFYGTYEEAEEEGWRMLEAIKKFDAEQELCIEACWAY